MTVAQLDSLVTLLRSRPAPETPDVGQARARYEKLARLLGGAPDAKCEKVDAGGVPAEWVAAPGVDSQRAVLYLHGGGYAIGSIETHRRLAYDLSAACGVRVLLIDYRLAPEHPFPAAVEDAAAAWSWLLQQGFPANRLAIAGDSAGGGLTIATLINLRDRRLGLPACGAAPCRPRRPAADPGPGGHRRDLAGRCHAHCREAACRRGRGPPRDLAQHAACLSLLRADPLRRPGRMPGDRRLHSQQDGLRPEPTGGGST